MAAGHTNTAELYRAMKAKECKESYHAVHRHANRRRDRVGMPRPRAPKGPTPAAPEVPSARQLSFQFICPKAKAEGDAPSFLDRVLGRIPALDAALTAAGELADLIRRTAAGRLAGWVVKAKGGGAAELVRFASGLESDAATVSVALTESWSNGPVDGQINRLKIAAADCPDRHSPSLSGYTAGSAVDGVSRAGRLGSPLPAGRTGRSPMSGPRRPQHPPPAR